MKVYEDTVYLITGKLNDEIRRKMNSIPSYSFPAEELVPMGFCRTDTTTFNPDRTKTILRKGIFPEEGEKICQHLICRPYSEKWFYIGFTDCCIMLPRSIYSRKGEEND